MDDHSSGLDLLPFKIAPLSDKVGGDVSGFDLRNLRSGEQISAFKAALREFQVLAFHDQSLSPAELVALTQNFGEPQRHLLTQWQLPEQPEIYVLSNMVDNGRELGNSYEGMSWHTDLSGGNGTPGEKATVYTILQAIVVPEIGGATSFASTYRAYESLPEERRRVLDKLILSRSFTAQYDNRLKRLDARGIKHNYAPLTEEQRARGSKRLYQRIVDTNPHNGRKFLRLTTGGLIGVEGMPDSEGVALVTDLMNYCTSDQFRYVYEWRRGDILIWDNYGLLHRAGEYDREKYHRLIYRCSVGEEIVGQAAAVA